jgi:poly-gamma-glutamate synthesis protein (capsule biosynthesis protein)
VTETAREVSLLLAGDALITRAWSEVGDAPFLNLIGKIRAADVAVANLETVIHEFKGHAQADAGGVYMASPPLIAAELKWAGFDMFAHANNHAFDYGASGVLETIHHVEGEGLVIAGSGRDLRHARAPRYLRFGGSTVALVAMASAFVRYGRASASRPDVPGRPGINPLATRLRQIKMMPLRAVERLGNFLSRLCGVPRATSTFPKLEVVFAWGRRAEPSDLAANLEAISEAASNADIVVASIHAHTQGPWLATVARQAIDRGSHVVLVSGPHQIRGVELYQDRPIFYSLGNFVFESEYVTRLPAEAFQRVGLAPDAPVEALRASIDKHMSGLLRDREAFESIVAMISVASGRLNRIRLLPVDLNFEAKDGSRGRPQLASPEAGKRIIRVVERRSKRFKTPIRYDPVENIGEVILR